MTLTDLSYLPLLNIFNRLPAWKVLQLASLHSRLNKIKHELFSKKTQLRLLGGCQISKRNLWYLKRYLHSLGVNQNEVEFNFDLLLEFDHKHSNSRNDAVNRDEEMIKLTHDIYVRNLEQITDLAEMFPKLKSLTIAFTSLFRPPLLVQLLRNWPTLTHLYFVDFQPDTRDSLECDNAIMAINDLQNLQVLAIYSPQPSRYSPRNFPLNILEPVLQNAPKLKTLYFQVGNNTRTRLMVRRNEFDYRPRPRTNDLLQIPFDRFERFGLTNYWQERDRNHTNEQLISRTTRLEVSITSTGGIRHLINWSALQYLRLEISFDENSLTCVLDPLIHLHNLHEFHLIDNSNEFQMPPESRARQLPQLESVRHFEFRSRTSPYELYRFKWALPNVAELRLRLRYFYNFAQCKNLTDFGSNIKDELGDEYPESCVLDMKRAFLTYGSEIQDFYWIYYRNGRKDDGQAELVPMVQRYTKMIAGVRRVNFELEEIGQFAVDVN